MGERRTEHDFSDDVNVDQGNEKPIDAGAPAGRTMGGTARTAAPPRSRSKPSTRSSRSAPASRAAGGEPQPSTPGLPAIVIEQVSPTVDGGRFAPKRVVGQPCEVGAAIFKDGHDLLAARVRYRAPGDDTWRSAPLTYLYDADRWVGRVPLDRIGRWTFTIEAWTDRWGTWRAGFEKKLAAGQDVHVELLEGAELADGAARRQRFGEARTQLQQAAARLRDAAVDQAERARLALSPELHALMGEHYVPDDLTTYAAELPLYVDRERAAFASWYEFFPRSTSPEPGRHGTFADAEAMLPRLAELGFDVVYLPPIHPIGHTFRKGKNNTLSPEPDDVGSPWAIGNEHGGHDAVDPQLGTVADFERFVRRANELGMEVALDYALQCSPDHPWVKEHPDWFTIRPDGSIQYAENPPKKYQDIYPINFWSADREALWNACRDVLLFWIARGVKTFRVDNPHTKPFVFWEWVIREVQARHPEVVFLSEAFTRPNKLLALAKLGFTQSYTYFTWKNTSAELREWLGEFTRPEVLQYYRGNLFANTPDILNEFLVHGGRPAFRLRLLLAGTLSPLYGIYSGFELGENVPVRPGSEEYLDSEKYQLRQRDFAAAGNLDDDLRRLNRIRREQPALQRHDNLRLHRSDNDRILFFSRTRHGLFGPPRGDDLLIVVNLDPHGPQETLVDVPVDELGLGHDRDYQVEDLLTGVRYTWRGSRAYVRLDPGFEPGHVLRVVRE
ncbi:MAG TPA: alpha-1,4-glucan--maltose-1-phosphate maltosyltransferase [Gemmatimonadaceae bacterium]|nr:alpha-1,4-glucan--maltose-1-phosphate maltosyltransferase [Gemmatimonadaceae bacterium]